MIEIFKNKKIKPDKTGCKSKLSKFNKIELCEEHFIGEGRDRLCYRHPYKDLLCIKIPKHKEKQTRREIEYFNFCKKKNKDLSFISTFHGRVETNYGQGYLYDLALDKSNKPSMTMETALKNKETTIEELKKPLEELYLKIYKNSIYFYDVNLRNVCVINNGKVKHLYIIDGIKNENIDLITRRAPFINKLLIKKRWRIFYKKIMKYKNNID